MTPKFQHTLCVKDALFTSKCTSITLLMFLILDYERGDTESNVWQLSRSRSASSIWTSVPQKTHRGRQDMSRNHVYIHVRMSSDRKYKHGRNTWVSNCTTVGVLSTTDSRSCWASIPDFPASTLLWEPDRLPIELGSSPQGRLDIAVEFCEAAEGWKCDGHVVTENRLWVSLFPRWKQDFDHVSHALTLELWWNHFQAVSMVQAMSAVDTCQNIL